MKARQILDLLRAYESRNVTFIEADGSWPIVWERAKGVHVWDANGKRYLDLTGAFGVAAAGHANPRVVAAGQRQMGRLLHAMGDVHPHPLKAELARELSRLTFERWAQVKSKVQSPKSKVTARGKTIFCNSGFEAVEAALKTALLATGKPGVIAFTGAYHGLGYGALNATHREHFRSPFRSQLRQFARFVPFPVDQASSLQEVSGRPEACPALRSVEVQIQQHLESETIGAILVEPIQVRGGINIPPPGFLPLLRRLCDAHGTLLILDEVYTGFGRTGKWFACEHAAIVPDLICLGKALTGGFPLSACVGPTDVMDAAWPSSNGEAIHTSTFLGHPVGCAMALAQIRELHRRNLIRRSAQSGVMLLKLLRARISNPFFQISIRGLGLLVGVEMYQPSGSAATEPALKIIRAMLGQGFILLPEGEHSNVISFSPPLTISARQLGSAVNALAQLIGKL